jgi:prophage endopeptidase
MRDLLSGVIVLLLIFGGGYFYGQHVEAEAQQAEVDRLNTEARAKEVALTTAVTTTADALRKTNEKAKLAAQQRDAAIDSGALRLRLKATCPVPTAADPATPTGDSGGAPSADLDRETAKALIALTEEGDRAINKLNACIAAYSDVYNTLNQKK